ncbi:hypothetical protein Moror_12278 [Moniliophthora roreri MCA 2997]|uniref:Uncharacterized protein n=1 Tax=Moniliophthora roreri (strain MCA 2997) TaxID=1381753 RepID=V2WRF6_MONRO|nr:hypothetical protein Moror_12278 [Moniliophthora roreri MCA 2997]
MIVQSPEMDGQCAKSRDKYNGKRFSAVFLGLLNRNSLLYKTIKGKNYTMPCSICGIGNWMASEVQRMRLFWRL